MAERPNGGSGGNGGSSYANGAGRRRERVAPHDVAEARRELEATRQRMSSELDAIEARLRRVRGDVRQRLDVLAPARERIRADVWKSLALGFGVGLAYALLTARRHAGRRGFAGEVLHGAIAQLPGALLTGVRAGLGERLHQEWTAGALPPPSD